VNSDTRWSDVPEELRSEVVREMNKLADTYFKDEAFRRQYMEGLKPGEYLDMQQETADHSRLLGLAIRAAVYALQRAGR